MKVALAHDYLTQRGGAERVALAMTRIFPESQLITSLYEPGSTFPDFSKVNIRTSFLQRVGHFRKDPRLALPLLSKAWDGLRVTGADAVIASSSGWAHGISVPEGTKKIVYCHNPARWLYQPDDYMGRSWRRFAFAPIKARLAAWDARAAATADAYLANSWAVAERIERIYGVVAEVLHPPVSIDITGPQEEVPGLAPGFWMTVARNRGYKNVDAVIAGVEELGDGMLAIVGSQPPGHAESKHAKWLGIVSDAQLRWLYANARALISVAHEDFGLTPLEANAFGTPVAVLRAGGFLDSLAEGTSGVWVEQPTAGAVYDSLRSFPSLDRASITRHAESFNEKAFGVRLKQVITSIDRATIQRSASTPYAQRVIDLTEKAPPISQSTN